MKSVCVCENSSSFPSDIHYWPLMPLENLDVCKKKDGLGRGKEGRGEFN